MKRKICNSPGCNALIDTSERYCPLHKREQPAPFGNAVRYNESLYKTTRWRSLRAKVLREQTACFRCGTSEEKLEVHHLVPPRGNEELFFDENNLVAVCPTCHRTITNEEIRNRKRVNVGL
jgi:5-methylcytosine-specific restriction protein A